MKKFGLFIVFLSIALIVGCGDGSTSEEIPAVAEQEIRLTDAIPENPVNQPVAEGVFRRIWSDPPTLDPALVSDTTSMGIVAEVFSGLVTLNTDLRLEPDLAESWEISSDGTVYTFKISENAKFHNGKQVTATDFKWSLERAANPQTVSPVAETYLNDIVGVMDVIEGRASEITGIKVIDDRTLQITIDAPKAYFLAKLTYPTAFVVDRENVESGGQTWTDEINGTGPFKLKEYKIGERIVLERFDNLDENAGGVDLIVMNLAGGQSMAMYENNEIDITGVGLFDLERVLDPNEPLNRELVIAPPDFSISYIGFNTQMAPFDDVKFRQALNHAIDKKLIAEEVLSKYNKKYNGKIVTKISEIKNYCKAEEYHQKYLEKKF